MQALLPIDMVPDRPASVARINAQLINTSAGRAAVRHRPYSRTLTVPGVVEIHEI